MYRLEDAVVYKSAGVHGVQAANLPICLTTELPYGKTADRISEPTLRTTYVAPMIKLLLQWEICPKSIKGIQEGESKDEFVGHGDVSISFSISYYLSIHQHNLKSGIHFSNDISKYVK
jgi:hypothetical protein